MLRGVLLVVLVTYAAAAEFPQDELLQRISERYSDNVLEDASLDVVSLITKYRYPVEVHNVTTEDGYILQMHRIPHGRDANNNPNQKRPVVFVMHGLLSLSSHFVVMGPGTALGYILAEEGFDVWMGNARGNTFSRRHVTLSPESSPNNPFWTFSWDEIGNYDLPAMIDYALAVSGQERLHYIGHSQGTTVFFVMGSLRPEYNKKIISMHAMAPVAYMANNRSPFLRMISPFSNNIESIASLIGYGEFLESSEMHAWAGATFCRDEVVFQPICSSMLFLLGGWNEDQHNATMLPAIMGHGSGGSSVRQLAHYGQGITGKEFRRYNQGTRLANYRKYGSFTPPRYDLSKVTTPVFLHYSDSDPLAHVNDVDRLFSELGRAMGKFRVTQSTFSHIDFLFGTDAYGYIYKRMMTLIKTMDANA